MRRLRSRSGGALILALGMTAILGLIAAALIRVSLSRTLLFSTDRDRSNGDLAAQIVFARLSACLADSPPASAACPPNWNLSSVGGTGTLTASMVIDVSGRPYGVTCSYLRDTGVMTLVAAPN